MIDANGIPATSYYSNSISLNSTQIRGIAQSLSTDPVIRDAYVAASVVSSAGVGILQRLSPSGRDGCSLFTPVAHNNLGPNTGPVFGEIPHIVVTGPTAPETSVSLMSNYVCPITYVPKQGVTPSAETPVEATVLVSPNPVLQGHTLQVKLDSDIAGPIDVAVVNTLGQTVYRTQLPTKIATQSLVIPTQGWAPGSYSLRLTAGARTMQSSFIVSAP